MAQYYPIKRKVQVAVADSGVGFLTHLGQAFSEITTDEQAIIKAIEMGVTASNNRIYGHERNARYGLYALLQIIKETRGHVVIISNTGMLRCEGGHINTYTLNQSWDGTVVAFEFIEENTDYEFDQMLQQCIFGEIEENENFF